MARLRLVAQAAGEADLSRITDLVLARVAGGDTRLFATTRADGRLESWSIGGNGLSLEDTVELSGSDRAGAAAQIAVVETPGDPALLSGGDRAPFALWRAQEEFGPARTLGGTGLPGGLADPEALSLPGGRIAVYGGLSDRRGIGAVLLDPDGGLSRIATLPTPAALSDPVTALAHARLGGTDYLFATSAGVPGLGVFSISRDGRLTDRGGLSAEDGLWVSRATTLSAIEAYGSDYLVLGAAGSSSISVIRAGRDGALSVTDHLLDDRDSRFAGITALETVSHRGRSYVISGGADDGISLHLLLPDERLLGLAHLADGPTSGLSNVSSLAARGAGNGIDIFVASATETGLTRLRADLGAQGVTETGSRATGGTGADLLVATGEGRLSAGAGDDILIDGAGADRLRGGAGADIFVLGIDGRTDVIEDFETGKDRVDLSAWPMLRDISQLRATRMEAELRLVYGTETLILRGADGRAPRLEDLDTGDLIGATHLPLRSVAGHSAPPSETPLTPPTTVTEGYEARQRAEAEARKRAEAEKRAEEPVPPDTDPDPPVVSEPDKDVTDHLAGGAGADRLSGGAGSDRIFGGAGDDRLFGRKGSDHLTGGAGNDRLEGGAQDDRLFGGTGQDLLRGQGGNDRLLGQKGNDRLFGGVGADRLGGGAGDDRLSGGKGADLLKGHGGGDTLLGQKGNDRLLGGAGSDRLGGGANDDRLSGGRGSDLLKGHGGDDTLLGQKGADRLLGGNGADRLSGGSQADRLFGGRGADRLDGGAGGDLLTGGKGADSFVFTKGRDRIADLQPQDSLLLDDALWRGDLAPRQILDRYAQTRDGDTLFDFGGGNTLRIDDLARPADLLGQIDLI